MRQIGILAGLVVMMVAGQAHVTAASTYTLRWGDTLSRVGRHFGVPVRTLASANGIRDPDRVREGRELRLPTRFGVAPLPSPVVVATGTGAHRVERGQTLTSIAGRYGVSVSALTRANGLPSANRVRAGQLLKVPGQRWLCPVQGRRSFTDTWGAPRPGGRRHLGVDVFAARGTPVVASVSGVVEHAPGAVAGLAYYLHGDDGNTYYGSHLDVLIARPGRVQRGALLGRVGTTGNAQGTPPHLHFELKQAGRTSVNPYPTVAKWC